MRTHSYFSAALLAAALFVSGCGGPADRAWVEGKVVRGGAAYKVADDRSLRMTFHPEDAKQAGRFYAASFDREAGTFTVPGPDGAGIPRGKYRVEVVENPRSGSLRGKEKVGRSRVNDDTDYFEGRFAVPGSPFVFDVGEAPEVTIDLDRPGNPPSSATAARASRRAMRVAD